MVAQVTLDSKLEDVRVALQALLAARPDAGEAGRALLTAAAAELTAARLPEDTAVPLRKPACRHLDRIWQLTDEGPDAVRMMGAALRRIEPQLTWRQNPNYRVDNLGAHYLDNYAYCDLLGPRGLLPSDRMAVGFLLLGPGLHYPDHAHEAEEVYLVMAGDSRWRRDKNDWQPKPPGSLIHHAPWLRHATKSGDEPLLALYAWRGALDRHAQLVE